LRSRESRRQYLIDNFWDTLRGTILPLSFTFPPH
jgi:hypothetical protein